MRHRLYIILCLLLCQASAKAQYGMGIAGGTWEGVWGVGSQPACLTLNPDRAEIQILRAGVDLDNSYLFLGKEQFGLFGFGSAADQLHAPLLRLFAEGPLTAPAGMDLCFHHCHGTAERGVGCRGLGRGSGHAIGQHRHAKIGE